MAVCVEHLREAIDRMAEEGLESPTAFEAETVMSFEYFVMQDCDFVVLETGMGGRLDATNVIEKPLLTVITSISMDHMAFLGNSIAEIAAEKGGIIKQGRPAVMDGRDREAVAVLEKICKERGCSYTVTAYDRIENIHGDLSEGQYFDYRQRKHLHTMMLGRYQTANAAVALDAVDLLKKLSEETFGSPAVQMLSERLTESVIFEGIENARWPGRFEVAAHQPLVIVDGAHNPDGMRALTASVRQYLSGWTVVLVMGVFADKDYPQMLAIASEISDKLITFRPSQARGLDASALADAAKDYFVHIESAKSQSEALQKAFAYCKADKKTMILSCGSLSTIAGLKTEIKRFSWKE
jgi:dihydrofolate synthase/folylpolyglutamate synthase